MQANIIISTLILLFHFHHGNLSPVTEDSRYWKTLGENAIEDALKEKRNENVAKNVVIFVGDGMGIATITAARIFKGQLMGKSGEEGYLSFEKFKTVGLLKTYNVNKQVPDSAGTATAMFTGVKGNYYIVGMDATAKFNVCMPDIESKAKVPSIIDWAIEAGKSTGIVTTTRITHATPASAYAHSAHRDWECDSEIPESEKQKGCKDIARQLVEDEPGRDINVIFGGGEEVMKPIKNGTGTCERSDDRDLVWQWMQWQKGKKRSYAHVTNREELKKTKDSVDHVLGLFSPSHLPYDKDRDEDTQPSLKEMTEKAIKILKKNRRGFLLIVEGGRIDHAHHDNLAKISLEETVAFDDAIEMAVKELDTKDSLIVVTADHSHAMTINGYPDRGNAIEGVAQVTPDEGFPYQTMTYANGPGYAYHRSEEILFTELNSTNTLNTWLNLNDSTDDVTDRRFQHFSGIWADSETHGGEDVAVYATGPMGHLFTGVHEQTHIAYAVAYSACIGPYRKKCKREEAGGNNHGSSLSANANQFYLISTLIFGAHLYKNLS